MWLDDDPLEGLSRDQIDALAGSVMDPKGFKVSLPEARLPKLGSRGKGTLRPLPGDIPNNLRPNDTVTVSIGLPAYLVIGCSELGGVEVVARRAIRDALRDANIKWWYPRFLIRVDLPQ